MHALTELRGRRNLSQEKFARLVGCSVFVLSRIERGRQRAGNRVVCQIAEALGLSVDDARKLADGQMPEGLGGSANEHAGNAVRNAG